MSPVLSSKDAGDELPDIITAVDGNGNDVNAGFGGDYVWLYLLWTDSALEAITDIKILVSDEAIPGKQDLAQGAGGAYRYIGFIKGPPPIRTINLLRRTDELTPETIKDLGFDGYSQDINAGRGGDYLHLVWKYV
ncbi:hypothetical protein BDV34DRAFT_220112 [Aspergillus parasiticus]|uniref:Uncharacterized protein n=1 Tax=Aspergillus parasiticus TaxID=5067 RepID=A0A5N6E175_ASPPA|nr:hypothetical protein BDV34DRAFT_220112 [Aspergillus parasiticus]